MSSISQSGHVWYIWPVHLAFQENLSFYPITKSEVFDIKQWSICHKTMQMHIISCLCVLLIIHHPNDPILIWILESDNSFQINCSWIAQLFSTHWGSNIVLKTYQWKEMLQTMKVSTANNAVRSRTNEMSLYFLGDD